MLNRFRSQVIEVLNRNTFVSLALADGFNAFFPVYDGGIDLILYRERDAKSGIDPLLRKVQLKGRWTIDRKYVGRDLWIAFPIEGAWHLMPHDEMMASAEADGATKTKSWTETGLYSRPKPSKKVVAACKAYRFATNADVAGEAALATYGSWEDSPGPGWPAGRPAPSLGDPFTQAVETRPTPDGGDALGGDAIGEPDEPTGSVDQC